MSYLYSHQLRCLVAFLLCFSALAWGGCQQDESATRAPFNKENKPASARNGETGSVPPSATRRVHNPKYLASLPSGFKLPEDGDEVGLRILSDYGSVFVARGITAPPTVRFRSPAECADWQASLEVARAEIRGITVELQKPALAALQAARAEANQAQLDITPRGEDASRRSYETTVALWRSRVEPALSHWVSAGRLSSPEAERIRALPPADQVPAVLELESRGMFFSKDFAKSILYSVAAPGTSQHLSLLALDVAEYSNPQVRAILAQHGWFQTVKSDLPHFTYLGVGEAELADLGLNDETMNGQRFWVPDIR
jgi:hypothetical protein